MTGQVKEDIINRWAELGLNSNNGKLEFNPFILRKSELILEESFLTYIDFEGEFQKVKVPKNSLAFTYCQIPIIYTLKNKNQIILYRAEGADQVIDGLCLDVQESKDIFKRKGLVLKIEVGLKNDQFI